MTIPEPPPEPAAAAPVPRPGAGAGVPVSEPDRIPGLDGLRGLAILMVLVHHFTELPRAHGIEKAVASIAKTGLVGVDLFFVLSGFLITGILLDAKGGRHYFRNFYARRTLRIFPLYYGFLFVLFGLLPLLFPHEQSFHEVAAGRGWLWTYTVNVAQALRGSFDAAPPHTHHFWSLAVEEQFYLIWPLLVLVLSRGGLMGVCVALMAFSPLLRLYLLTHAPSGLASYVLTPARLDAFAPGALLALAARGPGGLGRLRRLTRPVLAIGVAALAIFFVWRQRLPAFDLRVQTLGYSVLECFFGALILVVLTARPRSLPARLSSHPVMRFFGKYSYGLYVIHVLISNLLREHLLGAGGLPVLLGTRLPAQLGYTGLAFALTVGLAYASWHLYEKRLLALKRHFPY